MVQCGDENKSDYFPELPIRALSVMHIPAILDATTDITNSISQNANVQRSKSLLT